MPPDQLPPEPQPSLWKRLQQSWSSSRWTVIGSLWLLTVILGIVGFRQYYLYNDNPQPVLNYWYKTLQLFTIESGSVEGYVPWTLQIARWLAPAIAAYTALVALALLFNEQFQLLRLRRFRNHVIICGLGRKGYLLAQGFLRRGDRVVVIEKDAENDYIEPCRELGALVLSGDATKLEMLERCGVRQAHYLVAVNGEDSTNAEIAVIVKRMVDLSSQGRPASQYSGETLTCLVHILEPRLCELLHQHEIAASSDGRFRLEFFNVFDMGARAVLERYPPFTPDAASEPHILLIGLGGMGQSLVVRAARQWRERQRRLPEDQRRPLHITIIDRMANYKAENLALRFPRLSAVCSLHLYQVDILWPEFQRCEFLEPQAGIPPVSIVYVCLDNDSLGLSASLTLQQKLRSVSPGSAFIRDPQAMSVILRTSNELGVGGLLATGADQEGARIHAFGLLEQTCQPELLLGGSHEILARLLYEDYCQIQQNLKDPARNTAGLPPWEALPEAEREKNRRQADRLGVTLKAAGFGIQPLTDWDAETLPLPVDDATRMGRVEHRRYVAEMQKNGWTLGPRDPKKKTNPNLLDWEALPEEIKELNRATFYPIPRLLAEAGLEVYRLNSKEAHHVE